MFLAISATTPTDIRKQIFINTTNYRMGHDQGWQERHARETVKQDVGKTEKLERKKDSRNEHRNFAVVKYLLRYILNNELLTVTQDLRA